MVTRSSLARLIVARRQSAHLTQEDLARELTNRGASYSRESIARIETGNQQIIEPQQANALAKVLPLTVSELCAAMGYDVDDSSISTDEIEFVAMARLVRPHHLPGFLEACRGLVRGFLRLDEEGPQ